MTKMRIFLYNSMRPIPLGENCYMVEWKYKDFLRMGHEFQSGTIVKLEKILHVGREYVKITICGSKKDEITTI